MVYLKTARISRSRRCFLGRRCGRYARVSAEQTGFLAVISLQITARTAKPSAWVTDQCSVGEVRGRRLELEAEPRAGVGNPGIVGRQIGVRHMVDVPRYADVGRHLITEFEAFAEQRRRAELLAVRRGAVGKTILQRATQAAIGEQTASPPEQVLDQRDPPGEAEIAGVRIARGVERAAEVRPWGADDAEGLRRGEQHLEIDVRSRLDV